MVKSVRPSPGKVRRSSAVARSPKGGGRDLKGGEARLPKSAKTSSPKARSAAARTASDARIDRLVQRLAKARALIAELEARADTDALLDILNRRGFERELRRSIAYVKRYGATAAVLFLDVDRLKPINDRFGHAAGDVLLRKIAEILLTHVRQSDLVARLGGDEFGILLWNLSEADALAKGVALEQEIDGASCEYRGRQISVGISAGVTMVSGADDVAAVLERADEMMYRRKQLRRRARSASLKR